MAEGQMYKLYQEGIITEDGYNDYLEGQKRRLNENETEDKF